MKNRLTKQTSHRLSSSVLIITATLLFAMTVICTGLACSRGTSLANPNQSPAVAIGKNENISTTTGNLQQGGRDEVRIELTDNGFLPTQVSHLAGTFAIAVENTSARDEYTLRLKANDGTVLRDVAVEKGSTAWSVTLQPGRYLLTEANHQQWICTINVE